LQLEDGSVAAGTSQDESSAVKKKQARFKPGIQSQSSGLLDAQASDRDLLRDFGIRTPVGARYGVI
jgi:hypothetical protein